MLDDLLLDAGLQFRFLRRPKPISPQFRTTWRLYLLLVCLNEGCRGRKGSLAKLHFLNWLMKADEHIERFGHYLEGKAPSYLLGISIEPALDYVLTIAAAESLITRDSSGNFLLTELGLIQARSEEVVTSFAQETKVLKFVKPLITKSLLEEISG